MRLTILLLVACSCLASAQEAGYAERIRVADSIRQANGVGMHELWFAPKARTLPAGHSSLTIYEVFTFNYIYAATSSTQLGLFFIPPIVEGFQNMITLNVKQNIYDSQNFSAAAWGAINLFSGYGGEGGVFTLGGADYNFNAAFLYGGKFPDDGKDAAIVLLGGDIKLSRSFHFIAEYGNFGESLTEIDSRLMGIALGGLRILAQGFIFDLSGVVPLLHHQEQYIVIPAIKMVYYF